MYSVNHIHVILINMAGVHDIRYKKLFSHPQLVKELLESFVDEDFVRNLDFSTLERLDKSFITDDFKEKESDLIYSISFKGTPVYIFLLMEFQSTVDKFMALRFLRYICEFYQSLDTGNSGKLPAVFPLLLYNGDAKWTAETCFENLVETSIPGRYIPRFEYFKLAENEFSQDFLLQIRNVVSAVFLVENSGIEELSKEVKKLYTILKDEKIEVIDLFILWLNNYLGNIKDYDDEVKHLSSLKEIPGMLATSLEIHDRKIADKARQQGIEQGIEHERLKTAKNLKDNSVSMEIISKSTGLSREEIEKL